MATQLKQKPVIITIVAVVVVALIGYLVYSKFAAAPQGKRAGGPVNVKAMQVIKRDTPLNYEYAGNIKSTDEVTITSRVSGTIVEKYISGGEFVQCRTTTI